MGKRPIIHRNTERVCIAHWEHGDGEVDTNMAHWRQNG